MFNSIIARFNYFIYYLSTTMLFNIILCTWNVKSQTCLDCDCLVVSDNISMRCFVGHIFRLFFSLVFLSFVCMFETVAKCYQFISYSFIGQASNKFYGYCKHNILYTIYIRWPVLPEIDYFYLMTQTKIIINL